MEINKEFCTYEQALALKQLEFEEPCLAHFIGFGDGTKENGKYKIIQQQVFYPNDYIKLDDKAEELGLHSFYICGVPLKQQVFRWFREKYNLLSYIDFNETFRYNIDFSKSILGFQKWTKINVQN